MMSKGEGDKGMKVPPFQINEVMYLYSRIAKLKPSTLLEKGQDEPQDIVNISSEAKKKQILTQARSEVLEKIRDVR
jgi:hypothetical protein